MSSSTPFQTLIAAGLLLCLASTAEAGINVWTSNGPGGGDVRVLAIDPITAATLYAGTSGGVFKSLDASESWSAVNVGLTHTDVRALAIDPTTPATLYAGTSRGVFKSLDAGESWSAVDLGGARVLAIDPTTPTTLYAAADARVFKSLDAGASWTASSGLETTRNVMALAIDPKTPTTLYAGTFGDGVFKSLDAGESWSLVHTGLTNGDVLALAIDPTTPTTLYAGTLGGGVFKSLDAGESWSTVRGGEFVIALAIDPTNPATLYAGTAVFEDLSVGGVLRSLDAGASWSAVDSGLPGSDVPALAIDPMTPATLHAGTRGGGVFSLTQAAAVSGTKEVRGDFRAGGTVVYTVTLINDGLADQGDNPGDELVDTLPPQLTLVDATVSAGGGTVAADPGTHTVTWNGAIAAGGSVVIRIEATIDPDAGGGTIANQGQITFDSDGDGLSDTTVLTDDPSVTGTDDPTSFEVQNPACLATHGAVCLNGGRFRVETRWQDFAGNGGAGLGQQLTADTGYFWFFTPANVEVIVKVLDACNLDPFNNYWVFAAGLTNVGVTLTVTDTETGEAKTYENPLGQAFQPIQDTAAFAVCTSPRP